MVANQILQHTVDGIYNIASTPIYIFDSELNLLVGSDEKGEEYTESIKKAMAYDEDEVTVDGCIFIKIYDESDLSLILLICGDGEESLRLARLSSFQLDGLLTAYRQHYDRDDFIKNLLLDNLLLIDILNRSQKLHISMHVRRVVYMIETGTERDSSMMDVIRSVFSGTGRDFITAVDEKDIIVVKELNPEEDEPDIAEIATALADMLSTEVMTDCRVSYGSIVDDIRDVSRSYKEAKMALDVGAIFYSRRKVVAYSNLGIGRLIYQLPVPLCRMFISEIFGDAAPVSFDDETLATVNKFFEDNLNVSKTSRDLYIHRNTLVYRLEKLKNVTGLDIQTFDDAITFQIALMVLKYMDYLDNAS